MNSDKDALEYFPELTEAYEVVRTVEVVVARRTYRVEVLKSRKPEETYVARYWRLENLQQDVGALVQDTLRPWVSQPTADA